MQIMLITQRINQLRTALFKFLKPEPSNKLKITKCFSLPIIQ